MEKKEKEKMKKLQLAILIAFMMILSTFSMIISPAEASVYNYSITDIKQTAPDTIVVSAQCLFCSACNPNDPGWPDRGTGCTPFGCGYPPASFPSYVPCQHGSPNGRYAAIRLKDSSGNVIQMQKLICDQSNWPLNTLGSHNFVFSGLTLQLGESITIEADFYCSYCYHWYATPKTFVPNKYAIVFVPLNWQGDLASFNTEAQAQADFVIDNVGVLTDDNTEIIRVRENMVLNFDKTANGYKKFNKWADISQFAVDHDATGDRYVAITNEDIWGNVAGLSNWGPTVVVEKGATHVTAHELGHSWSLLDEYKYGGLLEGYWLTQAIYKYLYPIGSPPNSYPGDDPGTPGWSHGREFDGHRCIMGDASLGYNRAFCSAHTKDEGFPVGVRNYVGCTAHVDTAVQQEWATSSVGLVSTTITFYRNGTTPEIESIEGVPVVGKPMNFFRPSNYSIQVYSTEGDLIYNSNLTALFWLLPSQPIGGDQDPIQIDEMTVHWLAPAFSEAEVTVELKDNVQNEVLASQVVAINPTAEAWIDHIATDRAIYDFGQTVEVTTEMNTTLTSMDVTLDVSLLDPNNSVQDYESWIGTIYPTADPIKLYMDVPSSGIAGTWAVFAVVLNSTGQIQDAKKNLITVGADAIPPMTTLTIGSPSYTDIGGNVYSTSITSFTLLAIDNPGGIGVASTSYRIHNITYDSGWLVYSTSFYLAGLSDGEYSIDYYSTDNIGNTEPTNTVTVILDNTPPTTTLTIGEPKYLSGTAYVTPDTSFTLEAIDTSSGIYSTAYRIFNATYDSGWQTYTAPFYLTSLTDGIYAIEYNSTDNVGNVETTQTVTANCKTQYQITVTASPAGAQGGTFKVTYTKFGTTYTNVQKTTPWTEWVDKCTWVTLTAPLEAKIKYHFTEWAVNSVTYSDNTITVHMEGPKTATVVYKDYLGHAKEEINSLRTYVTQLYNNRKIGRTEYNHFTRDLAGIEKDIERAVKNLDKERVGYDDKMMGFEDLRIAVMELKHMIKDTQDWARRGKIPAANATWMIGELENIRMKLVSKARAEALAERALALKAIEDAEAKGKDTTKAETELAKVDRELFKAEQKIAQGKLAQAIQHFKHAFAHSQHAIKKAYDPTWTINYRDWIDELEEMDL
jgi:hypothetical protein